MNKKITMYELRYSKINNVGERGIYYISYISKAKAIKEKNKLIKLFPEATWRIQPIKRSNWFVIK